MAGCKAIRVAGDRADRGVHVAPGHLQLADPAQAFVEKVDFADDGNHDAQRLYPLGRAVPVVLDPERGFGEPTLLRGVRTEIIAELIAAGEPPDHIAAMYGVDVHEVHAAANYETTARQQPAA